MFDLPPAPPLRRRPFSKRLAGYLTFLIVSVFSAYFALTVGSSLLLKQIKKRREAGGGSGGGGGTKASARSRAEAVAAEPGIEGLEVVHDFIEVPILPDDDADGSDNINSGRKTTTTTTTTIHIARAGIDPSRRVALLLHGFPECWLSWRALMKELVEAGFEVAAMDMRGYNLSGRPGFDEVVEGSSAASSTKLTAMLPWSAAALKRYDLGALAADARAVAVHLSNSSNPSDPSSTRTRTVTLISHDWGGAVAWAAASVDSAAAREGAAATTTAGSVAADDDASKKQSRRRPQRVFDALVAMAIPHPECFQRNMNRQQLKRSWYIAFFQSPFVPEAFMAVDRASAIAGMLPRRDEQEAKEADEIAEAFTAPGAATASINYYRASVRAIAAGPLSRSDARAKRALKAGVDVPVLVLYAGRDSALGKELLAGTERYCHAGVEMHVLDSAHWIQLEKKKEVAERTLAFLERTGGNKARFV